LSNNSQKTETKESAMKKGICSQCNSSEVYKSDFAPLHAGGTPLGLYYPKISDLQLEVFLCASCGHLEINMAEKYLSRVSDLVKSDKWKKAG
jgi:hypothetical protein